MARARLCLFEVTRVQKTFINPPGLPVWKEFFTQVVTVEQQGAKTIYISGQVGVDNEQNLVGTGDLVAQAEQAFANLTKDPADSVR